MNAEPPPPPLPPLPWRRGQRIGIAAAIIGVLVALASCVGTVVLFFSGLIGFYRIPTTSMAPAIQRDDHLFTEGITYRYRPPARGEIIILKTQAVPDKRPAEKYVKRLVGLPGDRLRITGGTLYINDQPSPLRNKEGEIRYTNGVGNYLRSEDETFTVPEGSYFVLGDNSRASVDSRSWGAVPARAVVGRAVCCYAPRADVGWTR